MIKQIHLFIILIIFCCFNAIITAQKVVVSPELNMRNDFAYYIIPAGDDHTHVVRDKAYRLTIQTLTPKNEWTPETGIELKSKKWKIMEIYPSGSNISIFYQTLVDDYLILFHSIYKPNGEWISDDTVHYKKANQIHSALRIKTSSSQDWICFGYIGNNKKHYLTLYQRSTQLTLFDTCLTDILKYEDNSVEEIELNDHGQITLIGEIEVNKFIKKRVIYRLSFLSSEGALVAEKDIVFEDQWPLDIKMKNHPEKNHLFISGLYAEKNSSTPVGFYILDWDYANNSIEKNYTEISEELFKEWTGKERKKTYANNLLTQHLIFTDSNRVLVFYESNKELSRKPYFSSVSDGPLNISRWTDYYYEDILAIQFDEQQEISWEKVLHKKQFSQDDDGLFSSFFIFSTTDFLRIIFNDEIKSESTVSEYIVLPNGEFIRKSVLNTTQKNLFLRFRDAIQINSNSLIVPSEVNGKMNLVKITFDN
jgi:hypothetical protein